RFPAPEDEVALLRQEVKRLRAEKEDLSVEEAAKEAVETYRVMPTKAALPAERVMPERLVKMTALGLTVEDHDSQVESLLALLPEKGVKNVLEIAEKTNDPHVVDDLHRALVAYVASDQPLANWSEK